jgi:hypothetical protein
MALKLGTQTGSLMNHLMSGGRSIPAVGDGATLLHWTDREPATVIEVTTKKSGAIEVAVQEDKYRRVDSNGMSESQEYAYEPNPNGSISRFRLDPEKGWRALRKNEKGNWVLVKGGGSGVRFGVREKYHDFSF